MSAPGIIRRTLYLDDEPHPERDPFVGERCLQFFAFLFSLRSRCEKPRQKDKFPVAALVHNPSALRSL
jgi:hypothetical protein